jgi:hypothetical protein
MTYMDIWEISIGVAGIIIAFIVGFFADGVKSFFANVSERKLLRNALYREMSLLYERLIRYARIEFDDESAILARNEISMGMKTVFRVECYNYAKSKPIIFYQLKEASLIDEFYMLVQLLFDEEETTFEDLRLTICSTLEAVDRVMSFDFFDRSMLIKMSDKKLRKAFKERWTKSIEV